MQASIDQQSFTSSKLDLLDAISTDPRLSGSDFRVAFRLLQHANAETGAIFPSQERLAIQIGITPRAVRSSISNLVRFGWLTRSRRGRGCNAYCFEVRNINHMLDRLTGLNDQFREERLERKKASYQTPFDRKETSSRDRKETSSKHLKTTPEDNSCSEINEGTYPRETIPTDHSLFGPWIRLNIPDPTKHRAALRLLHEGKMTPELLKRLAA